MSFNRSTNVSNLKPDFDEQLWIIHIRTTIENEAETEIEVPVSIFNVPRILMATNPDSYTPQKVAIGPYHHWSPDLYEMERYKLAAAKRVQKQLQNAKFQCLVDQLAGLEARIQACYHKNLDLRNETLAWMMALDGSFLLEFLQIYAVKEGRTVMRASSIMSHLVDYAGRKSAHNIILRDMVMLENQIPLFVLRKILEIQLSSLELADEMLQAMLSGFSKELSPFRMMSLEARKISISQCAHLLDYLYQTIVPRVVGQQPQSEITESGDQSEGVQQQSTASAYSSYAKALFTQIWNMISKVNIRGPLGILKKLIISKPVKLVLKLPWKILSSLPGFSVLKRPVQYFMSTEDKKETEPSAQSIVVLASSPSAPINLF